MTDPLRFQIPPLAKGMSTGGAVSRIREGEGIRITGAQGGGLASFLTELGLQRSKPIVVLTSDGAGAESIAGDLRYHLGRRVGGMDEGAVQLFPPFGSDPYDELAPDRRAMIDLSKTLFRLCCDGTWRYLVISAPAILRRVVDKKEFESTCLPISKGDELNRDELVQMLTAGGYHHAKVVEDPGSYALRGGLVDIYSPYLGGPVRLDLWGDEIERIRRFDTATQQTAEEISEFWVHPVRIAGHTKPGMGLRAQERLREICDEVNQPTTQTTALIEDALSGRILVGSEGFEPAFHDLCSLLDYLPKDAIGCVENPEGVRMSWRRLQARASAAYMRRIDGGLPAFSPENFWTDPGDIENYFVDRTGVFVHGLEVTGGDEDPFLGAEPTVDLGVVSTADLGQRLRNASPVDSVGDRQVTALSHYLKALAQEGYRTSMVAHTKGQAKRLRSMLKGRGINAFDPENRPKGVSPEDVAVGTGDLRRGSLVPGDGLCFIAEEEVFGRRSRRRGAVPPKKKVSLDDLRTLHVGDHVVHAEHGIGRYEGLVRRSIRSSEMDFLLITYLDDDRLYVPVYRLNQIQKYRGKEAKAPRRDKLGGQSFARAMGAARKASRELAGKLLDLYARRAASTREPITAADDMYRTFEAGFLFEETRDQERAIDEVMMDLESPRPMDRLVCGDVGFGKTEVALRAAFRIAMEGRQVAVLVPTTVLAQQHLQTFKARFADYPIQVDMLSRFQTPRVNRKLVAALKDGTLDIAIGTHRLLSKDVHFKRLGLLVVDEEHRFGVAHKERIRALRASVDTLVLTATPIPRTLQMSFAGVRDLSLIGTAPASRRPVKTMICHDEPEVIRRAIERELKREGQVFFVHNRVRDIHRVAERVSQMAAGARVAVGHGQMKEQDLERVMLDFVAGRYDILVCTSIIESGLDIPRANTIVIDRADTFGMAQLYQIRGRVGRSVHQAYAYLIVPPMGNLSEEARQRVETLARYSDLGSGFSVATMDMEIRGAGNLLGAEQSGTINAVGFEMFLNLVGEATAQLRGEGITADVEPELTFLEPGFIKEEYMPEVGQRLSYYKQLASAKGEVEVEKIAALMVDRFGPLPLETEELVQIMVVKALARQLGLRGVEASRKWLTVHLAGDSKVNPDSVIEIIREEEGRARLTDDLKIKLRLKVGDESGPEAAIHFLQRLRAYDINSPIS